MKHTNSQKLIKVTYGLLQRTIPIVLVASLMFSISRPVYAAGNSALTVSPTGGSFALNTSFIVTVHEDSGTDAVNAVEADLTYDQTKLQFVSADISNSAFDNGLNPTGGSGIVKFSRAKNNSTHTGDQVVGAVTFTVLSTGSTSLTFANSSQIIRASDDVDVWNSSTNGGSYTLTPAGSGDYPSSPTTTSTTPSGGSTTNSTTSNSKSSAASRSKSNKWKILAPLLAVILIVLVFIGIKIKRRRGSTDVSSTPSSPVSNEPTPLSSPPASVPPEQDVVYPEAMRKK